MFTEKKIKAYEGLTPQDVPVLGNVEGYDEFTCNTRQRWEEAGYTVKPDAKPVPMRPHEKADYMLLYFLKKDVFNPVMREMTMSVTKRAKHFGNLSYRNKLRAFEEYIRKNRSILLAAFPEPSDFVYLVGENTCTMFHGYASVMADHAANILYKKKSFGEPEEIKNTIEYFNSL